MYLTWDRAQNICAEVDRRCFGQIRLFTKRQEYRHEVIYVEYEWNFKHFKTKFCFIKTQDFHGDAYVM
jgi:hypothetical protein